MYYVYRFLDKSDNIIYVGKTIDINKRIYVHFSPRGHLPLECYEKVSKIEYIECKNNTDMTMKEIYFINKFKPIYNVRDKIQTDELVIQEFENTQWINEYKLNEIHSIIDYYKSQISDLKLEIERLDTTYTEQCKKYFNLLDDYNWYKYLALSYRKLLNLDNVRSIEKDPYWNTRFSKNEEINGKYR